MVSQPLISNHDGIDTSFFQHLRNRSAILNYKAIIIANTDSLADFHAIDNYRNREILTVSFLDFADGIQNQLGTFIQATTVFILTSVPER